MHNANATHAITAMQPSRAKLITAWLDGQVAAKRIPFGEVIVSQDGHELLHHVNLGNHTNASTPIYRIYSMTKPVASLALLILHEQGKLLLTDPAWKYLGAAWKKTNMRVIDPSSPSSSSTYIPCTKTITVHHLLTHTSGLSHGLTPAEMNHPVDTYYAANGLSGGECLLTASNKFTTLQQFCDALARAPLSFQPGQAWQYSWSVELVGRIVEVVSGQSLEDFLRANLFDKLGMSDTSFFLKEDSRLMQMHVPTADRQSARPVRRPSEPLKYCSGSGGLYSTCADYSKFCDLLVNGGVVRSTGEQLVSAHTIDWFSTNHLRHPRTGQPVYIKELGRGDPIAHDLPDGVGFGLGVAVVGDTGFPNQLGTQGEFSWSGAANTYFFVSPRHKLTCVFATQVLLPLVQDLPLQAQLHAVVYGATSKL